MKKANFAAIARAAGISPQYLYQLRTHRRRPSVELAKRLEQATKEVTGKRVKAEAFLMPDRNHNPLYKENEKAG